MSGERRAIVTGSSGLIGSEAVAFLDERGWRVHGVDNNMRRDFFGAGRRHHAGTCERLRRETRALRAPRPRHPRPRRRRRARRRAPPDLIVHCAAQPSHDLAAQPPFDDFDVNAVGTLNLLEAARAALPRGAVRLHVAPTRSTATRRTSCRSSSCETRWDYADPADARRHRRDVPHRPVACTASSAPRRSPPTCIVQEYGRYFGMPTVCFRGGCLTGPNHSGAELHGFLAYLVKGDVEGRAVPDLRLQGQAGARQHPLATTSARAIDGLRRDAARRARSTTSAAAGRTASRCSRRSTASRSSTGGELETEYVDENRGAATTSATSVGSPPLPGRLSGLEHLAVARRHLRGLCPRAAATPRRIGQPVPASA